jgi:glutamate carboxypeptidase
MNLDFLKMLVEIDSSTHKVEGVNQVQKIIGSNLSSLGFDVKSFRNNQDKTGELLFAQRKGQSLKAITLVCHADTVVGPLDDFKFKLDLQAGRAYGPGIGDNKGAVAMALGSLKDFLEKNNDHYYTLNFVCSPSEETGSIGFHQFFEEIGKSSEYVLGLEPALSNGNIINQRSGNRWYKINIKGVSGHAGRWNEKTINAAHLASELISTLAPLSNFDLKRRVNVAKVHGGTDRYNVVCGDIEVRLDTRFKDFQSRDYIHHCILEKLHAFQESDEQVITDFEITDDCPPLSLNARSTVLSNSIIKQIKIFEGKNIFAEYSGGAADVNYFQNENTISIDGLGPIAGKLHSKLEYIELESFYTRRHVLTSLLNELCKNQEGELYGNISL